MRFLKLLLAKQADVNCYLTVFSDTVFPTALQYCLRDEIMMRLLLNNGYKADKCFSCHHDSTWGSDGEDADCRPGRKIPVSTGHSAPLIQMFGFMIL